VNAADLVQLAVAATADAADSPSRLTREWQLQPATVTGPDAFRPVVVFDGDGVLGGVSTPVPVTSLVGYLAADARVMVLRIPPAGNYVISDISVPGWTSYADSFAWTSSGVAPAIGDGTLNYAEYRKHTHDDLFDVRFSLTFGATTNFGTGVWFFNTPLTVGANEVGVPAIGAAWAFDPGVKEAGGIVKIETTSTVRIAAAPSTGGAFSNWGPADPFAWAAGDTILAQFSASRG